jgi:hypothetical protein
MIRRGWKYVVKDQEAAQWWWTAMVLSIVLTLTLLAARM